MKNQLCFVKSLCTLMNILMCFRSINFFNKIAKPFVMPLMTSQTVLTFATETHTSCLAQTLCAEITSAIYISEYKQSLIFFNFVATPEYKQSLIFFNFVATPMKNVMFPSFFSFKILAGKWKKKFCKNFNKIWYWNYLKSKSELSTEIKLFLSSLKMALSQSNRWH